MIDTNSLLLRIRELEEQLASKNSQIKLLESKLANSNSIDEPDTDGETKENSGSKLNHVQLRFDREQFRKLQIAMSFTALNADQTPRGKNGLKNRSLTIRQFFRKLICDATAAMDGGNLVLPKTRLPSLSHSDVLKYYGLPLEAEYITKIDKILEKNGLTYGRADLIRYLVLREHDHFCASSPVAAGAQGTGD